MLVIVVSKPVQVKQYSKKIDSCTWLQFHPKSACFSYRVLDWSIFCWSHTMKFLLDLIITSACCIQWLRGTLIYLVSFIWSQFRYKIQHLLHIFSSIRMPWYKYLISCRTYSNLLKKRDFLGIISPHNAPAVTGALSTDWYHPISSVGRSAFAALFEEGRLRDWNLGIGLWSDSWSTSCGLVVVLYMDIVSKCLYAFCTKGV